MGRSRPHGFVVKHHAPKKPAPWLHQPSLTHGRQCMAPARGLVALLSTEGHRSLVTIISGHASLRATILQPMVRSRPHSLRSGASSTPRSWHPGSSPGSMALVTSTARPDCTDNPFNVYVCWPNLAFDPGPKPVRLPPWSARIQSPFSANRAARFGPVNLIVRPFGAASDN